MIISEEFYLIVQEIENLYKRYRTNGRSRQSAIDTIMATYFAELQDDDDGIAVLIGISLALCAKKELTMEHANETRYAIHQYCRNPNLGESERQYLLKVESLLNDTFLQGEEASYRRRRTYVPDWRIGDLLSHTMTCHDAKHLGILGWTILLYKVGEYVDDMERHRQLMYVSLCPPGSEPTTSLQLQALGFLRMMPHGEKWDYLVQITLKSKKDELSYGLTRIGNFLDIIPPADRTEENPLVSMPLFGILRKDDVRPAYEEQICRLYRSYGKK